MPRKGIGGKDKERDKDRESRGFFERLQQLGDGGESKREAGSVGKDERGTEKEKKEKREKDDWKSQLTNIFSKDKERDKDRSKGKKEFDTTIEPLTLPPPHSHPQNAPQFNISVANPSPSQHPLVHTYNTIPTHDLAYHSTPSMSAPIMISSAQNLGQGGGADPLTRMVGLFVSPSAEGIDWALALELCEQTKGKERKDGKEGRDGKEGEANAKSIAKALRKELKCVMTLLR